MKDGVVGENPFVVGAPAYDKSTLDQRSAGQGELPLLDYLAAAPSTEFAVIEFDYVPGDMLEAVRAASNSCISTESADRQPKTSSAENQVVGSDSLRAKVSDSASVRTVGISEERSG